MTIVVKHPHKHTTPDGNESHEHAHERGNEIHHHGWNRGAPDPNSNSSHPTWVAADEGYYFDDLSDWKGEKRNHTPAALERPRTYEIPVVLVMTGFDNEFDAAQEACDQMSNIASGQPPVDSWDLPANLDITGADNRAGTIVYGSDNALIVRALSKLRAFVDPNELNGKSDDVTVVQDIDRLIGYLSRYTFDGA